jgi:hypothetical protein
MQGLLHVSLLHSLAIMNAIAQSVYLGDGNGLFHILLPNGSLIDRLCGNEKEPASL